MNNHTTIPPYLTKPRAEWTTADEAEWSEYQLVRQAAVESGHALPVPAIVDASPSALVSFPVQGNTYAQRPAAPHILRDTPAAESDLELHERYCTTPCEMCGQMPRDEGKHPDDYATDPIPCPNCGKDTDHPAARAAFDWDDEPATDIAALIEQSDLPEVIESDEPAAPRRKTWAAFMAELKADGLLDEDDLPPAA
jgi:hypothetical protein